MKRSDIIPEMIPILSQDLSKTTDELYRKASFAARHDRRVYSKCGHAFQVAKLLLFPSGSEVHA